MSDNAGVVGVSPEEAARLPGPALDLPQLPVTTDPAAAAPDAAPADDGAITITRPAGRDAAPAAAAPAPATRTVQGPRGTAAAIPDPVQDVSLLDRLRRGAQITPSSMPAARAQDFIQVGPRSIAVRQATEQEGTEIAEILGRQTPDQVRLISTRGDYMPTDVQEFVSAVRQANEGLYNELRRGVQTRDQQIELAQRQGLDGAVEMLLRRQPGEALNNEGLIAGSLALINITRETRASVADLLQVAPGSPGEAAALRRVGMNLALNASVAGQLNGAAAEAGRALGALRFVSDALAAAPPDQLGLMAQRLGVIGQAGPAAMRVPTSADDASIIDMLGGVDVIRTQAHAWSMLPDAASQNRFAQRSMGARFTDAVISAYINSLLWLPTTHLRNIMGTGSMMLWQVPERALAGAIGAARSRLPGMSQERVYMGEALAQLYGMYGSFGEAMSAAATAFRTNQPAGGISRMEIPRTNAISAEALQLSGPMGQAVDLLGTVLTLPGRALVTADSAFTTMGQRSELLAQSVRQAESMRAAGIAPAEIERTILANLANPPAMWRDAAEASARAMTFQDEMTGALGELDRVMQHPIAKLFVPFFRTPTNVARAVINRSPMALAVPGQAWADIRAGGARADLALARIALGSSVMWWFSSAVINSATDPDFRITGSRPSDPARRENFDRQGFQQFSFCEREGSRWTCRSFAGFDPLAGLMAMAADTATYSLDHPNASDRATAGLEEMAMGASFGLYQYMLSQPFLQGVSELSRVMGDTRLDSSTRFRRMAEQLTAQATGAVLSPLTMGTLGAGIERAIDPTNRSSLPTDPEAAQDAPMVRGFYQAMRRAQGRIPGASAALEPTLNLWGAPVQPTDGGLWQLFWPVRTTHGTGDALEETLLRLGGVFTMPGRQFPQTNVELTAGQYNGLVRAMNRPDSSGMTMREEMAMVVASPGFASIDPADQIAMLRQIRSGRWAGAQAEVMGGDVDLTRRVERDQEFRRVWGRSPQPDGSNQPTQR